MARIGRFAGTRRVHFGTGGHSRALATSRDTARNVLETLDRDRLLQKFLQTGRRRCLHWRDADSLLLYEGVMRRPLAFGPSNASPQREVADSSPSLRTNWLEPDYANHSAAAVRTRPPPLSRRERRGSRSRNMRPGSP